MLWRLREEDDGGVEFLRYRFRKHSTPPTIRLEYVLVVWFCFLFIILFIFILIINEEYFAMQCLAESWMVRNSNLKPTHIQLWLLRLYTHIDRSAD